MSSKFVRKYTKKKRKEWKMLIKIKNIRRKPSGEIKASKRST